MNQASDRIENSSSKRWGLVDVIVVFFLGLFLGVFAAVLGLLVFELILGHEPSGTFNFVLLTSLLYLGFAVSVWLWIIKFRGVTPRALGFNPVPIGAIYTMFPVFLLMLVVNVLVTLVMTLLLGPYENPQTQEIERLIISKQDLIGVLFTIAIVAPVVEETLFRGVLYRYLRSRLGVPISIILTSSVFAVVHFIPVIFPLLFVAGCFLAWVSEKYDSLYPSMFLHFLNNATMVLLLYSAMKL